MRDRVALIGLTVGLVGFCAVALTTGVYAASVGPALAAVVLVVGVVGVRAAVRHARVVRQLSDRCEPAELAGTPVRTGPLGDAAFVAGLCRPTIYCDRDLPERLTPRQLDAVLLHEQAHQRSWDPARLLLVGLVAPALRLLPVGRQWLATQLARREIAADRYAMAHGATASDLAGALLALPPLARAHVAGFTPAVDLRLGVLLGDGAEIVPSSARVRRAGMLSGGLIIGAALCTWVLHEHLVHLIGMVCC